MKKHCVVFQIPGGMICAEESSREVRLWDVDIVLDLIREGPYNPYSFYFKTLSREEHDLDSRETERSGMYYLGGEIRTREYIRNSNDDHSVLLLNMMTNGWEKVIVTSYGNTQPFMFEDTLLEANIKS